MALVSNYTLIPSTDPHGDVGRLQAERRDAVAQLADAERALAEEQAAVNRFRMHCRLKIGRWVDDVLALRETKQTLLAALALELDAADAADDWRTADDDADLLLPTDTPRDKAAEKRLFRELVRRFHPDAAATAVEKAYATNMMVAINHAYAAGDAATLRDLAGELDPSAAAELEKCPTPRVRRLRRDILNLNRRRRKVLHQQRVLRAENTAVLYRKAQRIEADGAAWWEEVRRELEAATVRLRQDIDALEHRLAATPDDK